MKNAGQLPLRAKWSSDAEGDGPLAVIAETEMFQKLLTINQEAFENAQFDVAYHALAAALHAARDAGDEAGLHQVMRRSEEQLTEIDAHHPEYQHSTVSAEKRGHESIFRMLARNANVRERLAHQEHAKEPHAA